LQNLIEFIDSSSDAEALLCQHEEWHCVVFVQRTSHATSTHARGHPSASSCLNIKITKKNDKEQQETQQESAFAAIPRAAAPAAAPILPSFGTKTKSHFAFPDN